MGGGRARKTAKLSYRYLIVSQHGPSSTGNRNPAPIPWAPGPCGPRTRTYMLYTKCKNKYKIQRRCIFSVFFITPLLHYYRRIQIDSLNKHTQKHLHLYSYIYRKSNTKRMPNKSLTDMSTKVGGRVFQPALPVVDGAPPTDLEQGFQSTLHDYTQENIPLESLEGIQLRERVLNELGALCRDWIRSVCVNKGFAPDIVDGAGGQLYTSGSYRLGVHEPGADIDCILVAPAMCHRHDFFGTALVAGASEDHPRDPSSLAERIRKHAEVTNFVPVEGAAVPILTFDWLGINIDLLFARLNINSIPSGFDIDNDGVLDGADGATEKSLNGPRVTNLIAAFVAGTPERYQAFLTVVRCVRKWAKARGLYSNKMGYWGGVNCNLAVALTVQLYPNACPATLLRRFFLVFKTWRWPQPVLLTAPHDAGYGLPVWSPLQAMRQVAPMITPAYPAMNSTLAVSRQTLQIMTEEFNRGHEIVDALWKEYQKDTSAELNWGRLFEPSDFFIAYPVRQFWTVWCELLLIGGTRWLILCSFFSTHSAICPCVSLAPHKKMHKHGT